MYNPNLYLLRVADAGSFNKAAEEAYITPTAVIKQINLLEAELDVKLFERTHRGLTLTKAGKSLYQDTKYIIQYCRDSVTRQKRHAGECEYHPYRYITYDACTAFNAAMAKDSGTLSRHEISNYSLRKHTGKCQRAFGKSRKKYRCDRRHF